MRRAPESGAQVPRLSERQQHAVDSTAPILRVLGGPGTGKTTVAVELIADAVEQGLRPDQCLLIASSRVAAGALRQAVTTRVGGTSTAPLARTWQAFGFGVLHAEATLAGEAAPRLIGGPEQDAILADLLAGHEVDGVPAPDWPESVRDALATRGFRHELRDLLMRAAEHDLGADDLVDLGRMHGRPEWVAAAQVMREYDDVTVLRAEGGNGPSLDAAALLTRVSTLLDTDPAALERVRHRIRLIVIDDAQELTSAAARLAGQLASAGIRTVLLGDPDSAVQTFRGADPRVLADGWLEWASRPDVADAVQHASVTLEENFRLTDPLVDVAQRVTRRIGALGGGEQRQMRAREGRAEVSVALLRSAAQEAHHIAATLRRAHLVDGVPWDEMVVITRGAATIRLLRRMLAQEGVPVASANQSTPIRDEPAVRPLLALLEHAVRIAKSIPWDPSDSSTAADPSRSSADSVDPAELLLSPIGGADSLTLRRLRRTLRRDELASGGQRTSDELLAELVRDPVRARSLGSVGRPAVRVADALAAGVDAAQRTASGWAPGVTGESVLWAIWNGSGIAAGWRRQAMEGGPAGERADRDLDAVLALFGAAASFVDRLPTAGPDTFADHLRSQDIPGDSLLVGAQVGAQVELLTPATAAGREWPLVVVAGVQEGSWPDLRLRGSILGSEDLVDVITDRRGGLRAAAAAVRYDETRLFHVAVTRASARLIVTAVGNEDEQPSPYLDLVDPPPEHRRLADEVRPHTDVARTMNLPGLIGSLRRDIVHPEPAVAEPALQVLAAAVREGVRGADPSGWWALRELSSHEPVRPADAPVRVSPSKVEYFHQCGLRWFLTASGGEGEPVGAASVGTLVHDVVAVAPDAPLDELTASIDAQWSRLGMPPGWVTERVQEQAHEMVRRYVGYRDQAAAAGWRVVGIETDFSVQIGRAQLSGRVDRLETDAEGQLRVIDLKTGSSKPKQDELADHGQLGAYQAAVEAGGFAELGTRSAGAALVFIGKAGLSGGKPSVQVQPPLDQADDPLWAQTLIEATAEGMGAANFVATIGSSCKTCSLMSSCPVQPEGRAL